MTLERKDRLQKHHQHDGKISPTSTATQFSELLSSSDLTIESLSSSSTAQLKDAGTPSSIEPSSQQSEQQKKPPIETAASISQHLQNRKSASYVRRFEALLWIIVPWMIVTVVEQQPQLIQFLINANDKDLLEVDKKFRQLAIEIQKKRDAELRSQNQNLTDTTSARNNGKDYEREAPPFEDGAGKKHDNQHQSKTSRNSVSLVNGIEDGDSAGITMESNHKTVPISSNHNSFLHHAGSSFRCPLDIHHNLQRKSSMTGNQEAPWNIRDSSLLLDDNDGANNYDSHFQSQSAKLLKMIEEFLSLPPRSSTRRYNDDDKLIGGNVMIYENGDGDGNKQGKMKGTTSFSKQYIRKRRIYFTGDSLLRQVFVSLSCWSLVLLSDYSDDYKSQFASNENVEIGSNNTFASQFSSSYDIAAWSDENKTHQEGTEFTEARVWLSIAEKWNDDDADRIDFSDSDGITSPGSGSSRQQQIELIYKHYEITKTVNNDINGSSEYDNPGDSHEFSNSRNSITDDQDEELNIFSKSCLNNEPMTAEVIKAVTWPEASNNTGFEAPGTSTDRKVVVQREQIQFSSSDIVVFKRENDFYNDENLAGEIFVKQGDHQASGLQKLEKCIRDKMEGKDPNRKNIRAKHRRKQKTRAWPLLLYMTSSVDQCNTSTQMSSTSSTSPQASYDRSTLRRNDDNEEIARLMSDPKNHQPYQDQGQQLQQTERRVLQDIVPLLGSFTDRDDKMKIPVGNLESFSGNPNIDKTDCQNLISSRLLDRLASSLMHHILTKSGRIVTDQV